MNAMTKLAKSKAAPTPPPPDVAIPRVIPSAPRLVPLGRLRRAEENVRHIRSDEGVDELADSIRAHGLLQSLIGYEQRETGFAQSRVMVLGGGRRLKALRQIEDEGLIDGDWLVPTLIRDRDDALELSLAENIEHRNMSPVDEFFAFKALIDTGRYDAAALAKRFGFTERVVRQRLRLAELDSEVLDALAGRELTLDAAMAYASSQDRALQRQVFKQHSKSTWEANKPDRIKRDLRAAGMDTGHRLYKFVGAQAYEAAGGDYEDDLFQAEAQERQLSAPHLLEQLAHDKLDRSEPAIVRELAARGDLSPTIEGVVRIPGLALHSKDYITAKLTAPAGFAAIEKQPYDSNRAWKTVRNNNLAARVAIGIDGDGKVQAYAHTLFVPKDQRTALEPPPGPDRSQPRTAEQEASGVREREIGVLAKRLAASVGGFAGTKFEGRAFWPAYTNYRLHDLNGERGWTVEAQLWASEAEVVAARAEAEREYDARLAAEAVAGSPALPEVAA